MNTLNNAINYETVMETTAAANTFAKDNVMSGEKPTVWEFILTARYFLPILTTVGFAISKLCDIEAKSFLDYFSMVLAYIGWVSALTVSPLKMLSFVWKSVKTGFTVVRGFIPFYGIADLAAAVIGVGLGLTFALVILAFFPAVFTITKFYREQEN